jgi:uncharacterized membrane protein YkvA (DUF1232 family)
MHIIRKIADWIATPYTIYLILKDPAISRWIKIRAVIGLVLVFAYIVSPIDIIPDFIPLSGWLDDLIVIPLVIILVRIITPDIDVIEKRESVKTNVRRILKWMILSFAVGILLLLLWLGLLVYIIVRLITA